MFLTIFLHELRYWAKQPSVYVYALVFMILAAGAMGGAAGVFGEESIQSRSESIANSPMGVYSLMNLFNKLILFLLPTIIGTSVYRDYKSNIHTLLYSYALTRIEYLSAKFLSGFVVVCLIAFSVAIGFILGTQLPGVQASLVVPFSPGIYLHVYTVYVIPNVLLFGLMVFAVVTFSRNIYAGFVTVVLLLIVRELMGRLLGGMDSQLMALLLEPFGEAATNHETRRWTTIEQNTLGIPFTGTIIANRLIWVTVSLAIGGVVNKYFSFSQTVSPLRFRKSDGKRVVKSNFGSITRVELPNVQYGFTFPDRLKATWQISQRDFRYIVASGSFISIVIGGSLFVVITLLQMNPQYGTRILPVTWVMLAFPVFFFSVVINLLTFLYAGMLVHRAANARINELIDVTPIPNWSMLLAQFIALLKMQVVLLAIPMAAGIAVQLYLGFDDINIGLYIFHLYGLYWVQFAIWACAAMFIQTLLPNPYMGLFVLILAAFGVTELHQIGIEHPLFRYNQNPDPGIFFSYSDLTGYGSLLLAYFIYKVYWGLAGILLVLCALLFWKRGVPQSLPERLHIAYTRLHGRTGVAIASTLVVFVGTGFLIYSGETAMINGVMKEAQIDEIADRKYSRFERIVQPRIVSVTVNMNIFPESREFNANGKYILINKSTQPIDTLLLRASPGVHTKYRLNRKSAVVINDSVTRIDILALSEGLKPGDSMDISFDVNGIPNTGLQKNSMVEANGTYITSVIFPEVGYRGTSAQPHPSDSSALGNHYRSIDSDYIDFAATVSTSEDQIGIVPGYLQNEWREGGRRYFRYVSTGPVTNDFAFISGNYEVRKDTSNGTGLEVYYHPAHPYNVERMMRGMKAALTYNAQFSPYQHTYARIVEYARTQGDFAQSFSSTIPYSEIGFILDIDDANERGIDLPFAGAAHELSHQWWGLQVMPADVLGSRMITEGMSEYVSMKVLEQEYGGEMKGRFLRKALDLYLHRRADDGEQEQPLVYNVGLSKSYVPYQKGLLAFNAMSEYLGEKQFEGALRKYVESVRFQKAPYTTSLEMVEYIRDATPDSLQYLIGDLFETVTLYDNSISGVTVTPLNDGKYNIDIEFVIRKYRDDGLGNRSYRGDVGDSLTFRSDDSDETLISLPLADYVEIGVFAKTTRDGKERAEVYRMKHKVSQIRNKLTITVDARPSEVCIDPDCILIDASPQDNSWKP